MLDQSSGKALMVGYFIEGTAFKSERERKYMLWEYIRSLCAEWEGIAMELEGLMQFHPNRGESLQSDSLPSTLYSVNASQEKLQPVRSSAQEMATEIRNFWLKQGHQQVQSNKNTLFVAVRNLGATLSEDASTFPWLFTVNSRTCTLTCVFSMNNEPYIIAPDHPIHAIAKLAMYVTSRLKIGAFRVNYKDRQVQYFHHFPYSTIAKGDIQTVLKTTVDSLTLTYKLYANAFVDLVRNLKIHRVPDSIEALIDPAEAVKPDYKSVGALVLTAKPKAVYLTRVLSLEDFKKEKQLYQEISTCKFLSDFVLPQTVVFREQALEVSCSILNSGFIKNYFKDHPDPPVLKLQTALLVLAMRLAEAQYHFESLIDVVFVQGEEVRLLLWKLADRVSHVLTCGQFEALLDMAQIAESAGNLKEVSQLMQLCSPNVIDCADIQETHGKFHYKKKGVRLKSLKAKENSKIADCLVFMLQLVAPIQSRLRSFQHIRGCCELKEDRWGLAPDLYRVEVDIPPINIQHLSLENATYVLTLVGEALISLHSKGYCCYCLNPTNVAFHDQQCVFLLSAMHSLVLRKWEWEQLDVRFFAPELVEALNETDDFKDVDYAADYYSFAMLMYALLVNPSVYEKYPEPLGYKPAHLQVVQQQYREGVRPLIPRDFEEAYPLTTSAIRLGLEYITFRPNLKEMLHALKSEGLYSSDYTHEVA